MSGKNEKPFSPSQTAAPASLADLRLLVIYEVKPYQGICGATVGADGAGVFAVGFTGEDADSKYGRFLEVCRKPGSRASILHVITETFCCETCLTLDPPCCLE